MNSQTTSSGYRARVAHTRAIPRRHLLTGSAAVTTLSQVGLLHAQARSGTPDFSAKELKELGKGGGAGRYFEFRENGRRYLGALSYAGVLRSADVVFNILSQPKHLKEALPATRDVKFLHPDGAEQGEQRIFVVQGTTLINGSYWATWDALPEKREIRFKLDPSRPHDTQDLSGFFRVQPFKRGSLLTAAVAIAPGSGLLASMFEGLVLDYMQRPARYIRRYVHRVTPKTRESNPRFRTKRTH